jgi:hypothetical protein
VTASVVQLRPGDQLLTKRQLAAALGRSARWIEMRVAEGMPSVGPTPRYPARRFRLADVEAWLSGDRPKRPTLEQRVADLEAKVASLLQREGAV